MTILWFAMLTKMSRGGMSVLHVTNCNASFSQYPPTEG